MGWLSRIFSRSRPGFAIRCAMCGQSTLYPIDRRGDFIPHSCGADLLVAERDAAAEEVALDLLVASFGRGNANDAAREEARNRLLYEEGEGAIPALEELLFRWKYVPSEPFPSPELVGRISPNEDQPRIDWSNELEMVLHRMKAFAITRRSHDAASESIRPILADKLARLREEPLEPIED